MSPREVDGAYGRAIAILDLLVMRWPESVGVREVAATVELPRTTVNRILMSLAEASACRVMANGRYRLGHRISVAAWVASRQNHWYKRVRELMAALATRCGETTMLTVLDDNGYARLIDVAESAKPLRYRVARGTPVPLTKGALGRALVGAMADGQFDAITGTGRFRDSGPAVSAMRDDSRKELSYNGYIVSIGEWIPEALGVSAPVIVDDVVVGAIATTIPRARESELDLAALGSAVSATAKQLSALPFHGDRGDTDAVEPPTRAVPGSIVERLVMAFDRVALTGQLAVDGLETVANCTPPTARRLVAETVSNGLLTLDRNRLVAGPVGLAWISKLSELDPRRIQSDILAATAARFDETVALGLLDSDTRRLRISQSHASTRPVHYALEPGDHLMLYAGAAGKAVLANLPSHTWPRELDPLTTATITDHSELTADLTGIREAGMAVSFGEHISDAVGIAAPVFDGLRVVGSITISIPRYRFDEKDLPTLTAAVREAAAMTTLLMTAESRPRSAAETPQPVRAQQY